MSSSISRPASVWLTQGLLLFLIFFSLGELINSFQNCPISKTETCSIGSTQRVFALILAGGHLALMVFGFWGLQRRKKYGRWIGILFWAELLVILLSSDGSRMVYHFMLHGNHDLAELYPRAYYKDFPINQFHPTHSGLVINAFATICVNFLFAALATHFLLAKTVRQFFSSRE